MSREFDLPQALENVIKIGAVVAAPLVLTSCDTILGPNVEAANRQAALELKQLIGITDQTTLEDLYGIAYRNSYEDQTWPYIPTNPNGTTPLVDYFGADGQKHTLTLLPNGEIEGDNSEAIYPNPSPLETKTLGKEGNKLVVYGSSVTASNLEKESNAIQQFLDDFSLRTDKPVAIHLVFVPNIRRQPFLLRNVTNLHIAPQDLILPPGVSGATGITRRPTSNTQEVGSVEGYTIIINVPFVHGNSPQFGFSLEQAVIEVLANEQMSIYAEDRRQKAGSFREHVTTAAGWLAALDDSFARLLLGDHYKAFAELVAKEMRRIGKEKRAQLAPGRFTVSDNYEMLHRVAAAIESGEILPKDYHLVHDWFDSQAAMMDGEIQRLQDEIDHRKKVGRQTRPFTRKLRNLQQRRIAFIRSAGSTLSLSMQQISDKAAGIEV